MRYIRAFFIALRMTLRGEKPQPPPYQALIDWLEATPALVKAVYAAADQHGMDKATRQAVQIKVDGREQPIQTLLAGVEYHARQEYPYLLQNPTSHSLVAIYASNMNDQYGVLRLKDHPRIAGTPLEQPVTRLATHLEGIPPSDSL